VKVINWKVRLSGQVSHPREIREKLGDEVIIVDLGDRVELLPRRRANLRKFFDSIEIDELKEWEELKRELWVW